MTDTPKGSDPAFPNWPTHADGTNKRVGEMTETERKAVMAAARDRYFAALSEQQ
jgi:hypothetical protein